jgi:chromate reductase
MARVIGIAVSLRKSSYNVALLRASLAFVPASSTLQIESIADVPLYNLDVEQERFPDAATRLKETIAESDGLLLATPEYNNSVPGVLKNVVDWLSRPASDAPRVVAGLPVAIKGNSHGRNGTVLAQAAWLPVLRTLKTLPWFGGLQIADAAPAFDDEGRLVDEAVTKLLESFVRGFVDFVAQHPQR